MSKRYLSTSEAIKAARQDAQQKKLATGDFAFGSAKMWNGDTVLTGGGPRWEKFGRDGKSKEHGYSEIDPNSPAGRKRKGR